MHVLLLTVQCHSAVCNSKVSSAICPKSVIIFATHIMHIYMYTCMYALYIVLHSQCSYAQLARLL